MHTKSSINIKPVSGNSEAHNFRKGKPLDYVRQDRTELNSSWSKETIHDARTRIESTYKKVVGQKMQAKATPIREGVVNLGKKQSVDNLRNMCDKLKERFGMKAIQIHIHEDEGHYRPKTGEWKQNRHAHIVFDWTDEKGKSLKLNKSDMAEMQTIVAEELGMERGQSSDKKHLSAIAYKIEAIEKDILQLEQETSQKKKDLKQLKDSIKRNEYGKNIANLTYEKLKSSVGVDRASKLEKELKTLKIEHSELKQKHGILYKNSEQLREKVEKTKNAMMEKAIAEQENRELKKENQQQKERIQKQNKGLSIATENEEIWRNNCKKIVTGEISLQQAKDFMIKNGYLKDRGANRNITPG